MQTDPAPPDDGPASVDGTPDAKPQETEEDAIRALVKRLSRPHPSGGRVIERAAILAAGANSSAILRWIAAHAWEAEELAALPTGSGLHAARIHDRGGLDGRAPLRYVLPPEALS